MSSFGPFSVLHLDVEAGRYRESGMFKLTESGTLLSVIETSLPASAWPFPDRSHQLQPLVLPQPSQT